MEETSNEIKYSDVEISITIHSSKVGVKAIQLLLNVIVTSLTKCLPNITLIESESKAKSTLGKVLCTVSSKFYLE